MWFFRGVETPWNKKQPTTSHLNLCRLTVSATGRPTTPMMDPRDLQNISPQQANLLHWLGQKRSWKTISEKSKKNQSINQSIHPSINQSINPFEPFAHCFFFFLGGGRRFQQLYGGIRDFQGGSVFYSPHYGMTNGQFEGQFATCNWKVFLQWLISMTLPQTN